MPQDARRPARRELVRVLLSRDHRRSIRRPRAPSVGDYRSELQVGVFQHLLNALLVLHHLPHQLLARAGQIAQFLDRPRRNEARADQPMRQQIRDPGGIVDVALASGDVVSVRRIGQHQLELAPQHMPHRLPIHSGGFHRYVGAARFAANPPGPTALCVVVGKLRTSRTSWFPCARPAPHTVHGEHSFPHLLSTRRRREARVIEIYQPCSGTCRSVATIKDARRASGQTTHRAASTMENRRPRCWQRAPLCLARFIGQHARSS